MVSERSPRTTLLLLASLGLVAALICQCGTDEEGRSSGPSSFLFAVISDTHIWSDPDAIQNRIFQETAHIFNNHNPPIDFVVLTGDIVHKLPSDDPTLYDENPYTPLGELIRLTSLLKMPLYLIMGNHDYYTGQKINDVITSDRRARERLFMDKAGMPGPYYAFEHKGIKFYCLNSLQQDPRVSWVPDLVGSFGPEQVRWLAEQLSDSLPAFIFHHHPLATPATTRAGLARFRPFEVPRAEGYFQKYKYTIYRDFTDPIYEVLKTHRTQIKAIFFGHTHLFMRDQYEGIPLYMTDSMEFPSHAEYNHKPMRYYIVQCQAYSGEFTIFNEHMIRYAYVPPETLP